MKAWIPTSIILTQLLWGETWTGESVTFPQENQMCSSLGTTMLAVNQTAESNALVHVRAHTTPG